MSDEQTESQNGTATNPVPFEDFVRQQFELMHKRIDGLEVALRAEMTERFVQLSRQGMETSEQVREVKDEVREVKEQLAEVREEIRDLDEKIDPFIREQMRLKRNLRDLQESLGPKN